MGICPLGTLTYNVYTSTKPINTGLTGIAVTDMLIVPHNTTNRNVYVYTLTLMRMLHLIAVWM